MHIYYKFHLMYFDKFAHSSNYHNNLDMECLHHHEASFTVFLVTLDPSPTEAITLFDFSHLIFFCSRILFKGNHVVYIFFCVWSWCLSLNTWFCNSSVLLYILVASFHCRVIFHCSVMPYFKRFIYLLAGICAFPLLHNLAE